MSRRRGPLVRGQVQVRVGSFALAQAPRGGWDDFLDFTRGELAVWGQGQSMVKRTYSPSAHYLLIRPLGLWPGTQPSCLTLPPPRLCLCLFLAPFGPVCLSSSPVCSLGSVRPSLCYSQPFDLCIRPLDSACLLERPHLSLSVCLSLSIHWPPCLELPPQGPCTPGSRQRIWSLPS